MNSSLSKYLDKIRRIDGKRIFFVVGTEKSGTTWLQMLLDHHPQACCKGEGQFATRLWPGLRKALEAYSAFVAELNRKVFREIEHFPVFREESIRAVQAFSASLLLSEYGDDERILAVGEKTPGHMRTLDRLKVLFPESKFVFICRDGRDIAVSGWYHLQRQHGADKAEALPTYAKRIATVWRQDHEKAMAFVARHPQDCVRLRYEDLHGNPVPELARILDFLGLDNSDGIIEQCVSACDFSKLAGGRERGQESLQSHFRKGIVGDWRNHFDHEAWAAFDAEAGELLATLGYPRETNTLLSGAALIAAEAQASPVAALGGAGPIGANTLLPNLMRIARKLIGNGEWQRAAETLRSALATGQDGFELRYLLGQSLRGGGNHAAAAEAFRAAAAFDSTHRDALLMVAVTLKEAEQPDSADAAYQHLLEVHPEFADGWCLYGVFMKGMKRFPEAIVALRESLRLREDIPTHNALVMALDEGGQTDQAIEEGRRLLDYKDRQAMLAFEQSPLRARRLDPPARVFDYKTPNRNIIAFSLWGEDPVYVHGAIVNARIAPNLYYGWRTRFYCDRSVPPDALDELRRCGAEIVMVEDPQLLPVRHLWRFLVSDDPDVDWFVCRDTDSRLNAQELLAVEEWVHSGKAFHLMRDHVYHMELILAGMWGGMARVLPNMREMILGNRDYAANRFSDQAFLMEMVWPQIKEHVLIHDSYYRLHGARDFPPGYRLPRPIHVGGAVKNIGTWRRS